MTLTIEACGLRCPLPVLRLAKALRGMAPGQSVALLADDPMAVIDVPHYCEQSGHSLLLHHDHGDHHMFVVQAAAPDPE